MPTLDRPQLRPLSAQRFEHQGQPFVMLQDPLGVVASPVLIPIHAFLRVVRHFDGETTLGEIQARVRRETGEIIPTEALETLVKQLDEALILDGPTFSAFLRDFRESHHRPPALAGRAYAASGGELREQLDRWFSAPQGSGPPTLPGSAVSTRIRGILSPHIDFQRGGPVYTWSYKELVEQTDAEVFVILGVAHQPCRNRFALTLKDFETPLGTARTDRDYVRGIADAAGGSDLFRDELVHRAEHSIEFQVVFLQYVLPPDRDFKIVPILVGSFHDHVERGSDPIGDPEVRRFVEALRTAEAASGKRVAYIGGIDLCHVGPEFGDPGPVDRSLQEQVRCFDRQMLDHAAAGDASRWFQTAAEVGDRWRVCGLATTYTMLHAIGPARGRLLKYDQALDPQRTCCVSFASMVFHSPDPTSNASCESDVNTTA